MPKSTPAMKELITRNAEEIRQLHARIHETVQLRDKSSEQKERWQRACAEFHARYDKLAFPGGYATAIERILSGDPEALRQRFALWSCVPTFFALDTCSKRCCLN